MHLLDTDTLTYLHAGHPRVVARLHGLPDDDVAMTIITRIEVLRGRYDFLLKPATAAQQRSPTSSALATPSSTAFPPASRPGRLSA